MGTQLFYRDGDTNWVKLFFLFFVEFRYATDPKAACQFVSAGGKHGLAKKIALLYNPAEMYLTGINNHRCSVARLISFGVHKEFGSSRDLCAYKRFQNPSPAMRDVSDNRFFVFRHNARRINGGVTLLSNLWKRFEICQQKYTGGQNKNLFF